MSLLGVPADLHCESKNCRRPATHVYGPECEATTGRLMYLCAGHAEFVITWRASHLNDPVECPTHGRIGTVRDYLVLKEIRP